jgi:hypothetical protein
MAAQRIAARSGKWARTMFRTAVRHDSLTAKEVLFSSAREEKLPPAFSLKTI